MDDVEPARVDMPQRWRPRPVASWSIRIAVFVAPVALGFVASLLISRSLPRPVGLTSEVLWWTVLVAAVLAVVVLATAACRRFLPLAALLNLSLLFPDQAPSRFAIARQTGSAKQLAAELQALRDAPVDAEPAVDRGRRNERILALVAALSVHDARTRGHSERVRVYTDMLSEQLGLEADDRDRLRWASMLHDIGKLVVPSEVLNKREPLDETDWSALRRHPLEGARILSPLAPWLGEWAQAAEHHHEWWDGSGYPRGLRHEQISLAGRIVAVADAYETMTASRPYRRAVTPVSARRELVNASGSQFDPRIVRAFLEISIGRLWRAVGVEALIAEIPLVGPVAWLTGRVSGWSGSAAATAGGVTVLAATGALLPASTHTFATAGPQRATASAAPSTGGTGVAPTTSSAAAGQPAAAASSPTVVSAVLAAATVRSGAGGSAGPTAAPVGAANTPPGGSTSHGASAFAPGHGYGPPPGQGGHAPGQLLN